MGQERSQEGDVGLDATDPELDLIFELAKPPTPTVNTTKSKKNTNAFSSFWKEMIKYMKFTERESVCEKEQKVQPARPGGGSDRNRKITISSWSGG